MAPIIALYPGQGSQKQGMAIDLYQASAKVRNLFELASDIARRNLYALLGEGSEEELTAHAQTAITLASRSAQVRLTELGIQSHVHSGFSLGELSAYASANIFNDETLFTIVQRRTALMDEMSARARETLGELGMAAVIGLDYQTVHQLLLELNLPRLYAANDNAPNQVVVSGLSESIARAKAAFLEKGAKRFIPLKVSGPFHTPFMEEASQPFRTFLDELEMTDPKDLVISSVDGSPITNVRQAREHLSQQLARPVRWTAVMQRINTMAGFDIAEVGSGTVLSGLCKNNGIQSSCLSLGEETTIQAYAKERAV